MRLTYDLVAIHLPTKPHTTQHVSNGGAFVAQLNWVSQRQRPYTSGAFGTGLN